MNAVLRGLRVIDPARRTDISPQDVWIESGRIRAIAPRINPDGVPVIDLTPPAGGDACVICPAFMDLHAHLREPGDGRSEDFESGARAAAHGGFSHVVAMANTDPPIDTPDAVRDARRRAQTERVTVLQVAAMTRGLRGSDVVDIKGCLDSGAVALSDDGRNAASVEVLTAALSAAGEESRPVLVHPEDEHDVASLNPTAASLVRAAERPSWIEERAVARALSALRDAPRGRLHLQHISTKGSVKLLREAREQGLDVTAEVTPHHIADWRGFDGVQPQLRKVNPPLRDEDDRIAVLDALRDGLIDAVATDHAPHHADEKARPFEDAAPGMIGLETALATCLTHGSMSDGWMPVLVERLTTGPYRVMRDAPGVDEPRLCIGALASSVVFDAQAEWLVERTTLQSRSHNTPLLGTRIRGRVLLTLHAGRITFIDDSRLGMLQREVAHA